MFLASLTFWWSESWEVDLQAGLLEVDPKAGSRSDKPMIVHWPCLQDFWGGSWFLGTGNSEDVIWWDYSNLIPQNGVFMACIMQPDLVDGWLWLWKVYSLLKSRLDWLDDARCDVGCVNVSDEFDFLVIWQGIFFCTALILCSSVRVSCFVTWLFIDVYRWFSMAN